MTAGTRVFDELHSPVRDATGRVVSAVAVFRDDTRGQAARQRLSLSERMAAAGTLAAGVAHEINNPMTDVAANIAWLLRELEAEGDAVALNLVQNAAHAIEPGQPAAEHIEPTAAALDEGRG